jgi:hypothetical protein
MLRGLSPPIGLPYPQKIHAQSLKRLAGCMKGRKPLPAVDSIEKGTNNVPHRGSGVLTEPPYLEKEPHGSHPTGLKVRCVKTLLIKFLGTLVLLNAPFPLSFTVCKDFANKGFGY